VYFKNKLSSCLGSILYNLLVHSVFTNHKTMKEPLKTKKYIKGV